MTSEWSLIAEIEGTFATGSAKKQAEILRRITDLFLAGASNYSDEQVDLFDGVISQLAERIEIKARVELAGRLAPADNAPAKTVRRLAHDESIEVAGPILAQSTRLTDDDLLVIANGNSQERLLAISKRATVSENVSDILVTRGNREVALSLTQNEGARFSDAGYGKLVDRSIDDEVLAICVGMRKDIPRKHFHTLISKASEVVFEKLAASNPTAVAEVQRVLNGITGQQVSAAMPDECDDAGPGVRPDRISAVQELAENGKFAETIAALSALAKVPKALVESVMSDRRGKNDFALLLAKAAGLSWPAAKAICIMRRGPGGLPPLAIEAARQSFANLKTETAQRVISFYNERHSALDDFELLEQQIGAQDEGAHAPRLGAAAS